MRDGPHIARIAALIGEAARAEMLSTLMGGQALTATELAAACEVTKQTASAHLARLLDAQLVSVWPQGRHRYYRLADEDVARLLEQLMGVAVRAGAIRVRTGPREPALREARVCYDHLAGERGVALFDSFIERRLLRHAAEELQLTQEGTAFFRRLGIDIDALHAERRALCRGCLDWSARRQHLAGALGAALLQRIYALRWARRATDSRAVVFTPAGLDAWKRELVHT